MRPIELPRAFILCTDLGSKSECLCYNLPAPRPHSRSHFPPPCAYLHAIYINACPHAKLLAKEPQPGHAVKKAVIELGRKRFGMYVWRTQEGCGPAPYPYSTPRALLWVLKAIDGENSPDWAQKLQGKILSMGVTS